MYPNAPGSPCLAHMACELVDKVLQLRVDIHGLIVNLLLARFNEDCRDELTLENGLST